MFVLNWSDYLDILVKFFIEVWFVCEIYVVFDEKECCLLGENYVCVLIG